MFSTMHPVDRLRLANDDHRHQIHAARHRRLSRLLRRQRAPGMLVQREEVALAA